MLYSYAWCTGIIDKFNLNSVYHGETKVSYLTNLLVLCCRGEDYMINDVQVSLEQYENCLKDFSLLATESPCVLWSTLIDKAMDGCMADLMEALDEWNR